MLQCKSNDFYYIDPVPRRLIVYTEYKIYKYVKHGQSIIERIQN